MKTQSELMREIDENELALKEGESFKKDSIGDEVEAAIRKLQDGAEAETKDKMPYSGQLCPLCKSIWTIYYKEFDRFDCVHCGHMFVLSTYRVKHVVPEAEINDKPNGAEPNPQTLADQLAEPIDPIKLEMEREAIAQRCIAFSRKQAGVTSAANIYDAYVAKNLVRLLTWHFDACKHPGSELADLSFEKIRKVNGI